MKQFGQHIIILTLALILLIALLFGWLLKTNNTYSYCATPVPILFCGTQANLSPLAEQGSQVFKATCAACHKLGKKATGPALRGVIDKYESDQHLIEYITNEKGWHQRKDPYVLKMNQEYNGFAMSHAFKLSEEELIQLLSYLEQ